MRTGSIFSDSSKPGRPRAIICDRSDSVRSDLKEILVSLLDIVGEASDGWAAADLIRRVRPDFVVIDIDLDGLEGLEFCRRYAHQGSGINVLVHTSARYATKYYNQLVRVGARGFCLKASGTSRLLEAVTHVLSGGEYCDPALKLLVTQSQGTHMPDSELTETEVTVLIRLDCRNKEIAEELDMKLRTVEKLIEVILAKLKVPTRVAAAAKAVEMGYVLLPSGE